MLTELLVNVALLGAEWVLYLLVGLSLLALALIIERGIVLRNSRKYLFALEQQMLGFADRDRKPVADIEGCRECTLLTKLEAAALATADDDSGQLLESQVQGAVAAYRRYLDRFTPVLGTLGNNAPFIGLLGTVIGVLVAFNQLSVEMEGGASSVMGGISEALVATATGIAVALPCVIFYNYFVRLSEGYVERFELLAWTKVKRHPDGS
jgi:biopolymer transport protein ExbB/TolQ